MGTNVIPQALFAAPRIPTHWGPKAPCFPAFSRPAELHSRSICVSRVSSCSIRTRLSNRGNRRFVVRADGDGVSGADAVAVEEGAPGAGLEDESEPQMAASTMEKPPRKPRIKLGDIMGILNKRAVEESDKERPIPDLRTGDVVEIKLEVPENRKRLSVYKGIVMSKQNAGIHTTIRVRRIIAGVGVEIVFPIYSPNIKEIKVVKHRKVRRARLYFLRDKLPRLSTFK